MKDKSYNSENGYGINLDDVVNLLSHGNGSEETSDELMNDINSILDTRSDPRNIPEVSWYELGEIIESSPAVLRNRKTLLRFYYKTTERNYEVIVNMINKHYQEIISSPDIFKKYTIHVQDKYDIAVTDKDSKITKLENLIKVYKRINESVRNNEALTLNRCQELEEDKKSMQEEIDTLQDNIAKLKSKMSNIKL